MIWSTMSKLLRAARHTRQWFCDETNRRQLGLLQEPFQIHHGTEFRTPQQICIEAHCRIQGNTILNGRSNIRSHGIRLGAETYIKERCYLDAYGGFIDFAGKSALAHGCFLHGGGGITAGEYVIIGPGVVIVASNHNYKSRELPIMLQGDTGKGITIGQNVWIGANAIILDGVTIGANVVVGAGSVISKDVEDGTLIANGPPQSICRKIEWNQE